MSERLMPGSRSPGRIALSMPSVLGMAAVWRVLFALAMTGLLWLGVRWALAGG